MNEGATRVLESLRVAAGAPRSGEALSAQLGVSRAQIWKHVETLRARGYTIDAAPGGGYRLTAVPDRLYPEEIGAGLATRWLARSVQWLDETDSTNRVAADLARGGAAHGTTVVAEGQTAGRGRLGRSFYSPAYRNLYTSIVLRPALNTAEAPTLILAAAAAVAETIARFVPDPGDAEIKWPNDILLSGLKTSGILMELTAEATRVSHAILGIGVNLNVDRGEFPDDFRDRATSLASHTGAPVDRIAFARALYEALEEILDLHAERGFEADRPRFEARFRMAGRRVRVVESGSGETSGTALGIDPDGSLRLRCDDGHTRRIVAGDVTLAREAS